MQRLLLFICTTAILAMSNATFLDDPSALSTDIKTIYHRNYDVRSLPIYRGLAQDPSLPIYEPDKKHEKKISNELRRSTRSVEAYGMPKKLLENNGMIDRIVPVVVDKAEKLENKPSRRVTRSSPKELGLEPPSEANDREANDLEAQDAKVFRPLFVYRQQVAKRQKLNKRRDHDYRSYHSQMYRPWVQRYVIY